MNKLRPGLVAKINVSGGDYKMMDNISQFQRAAQAYGVGEVDLFNANDLYEQKNIALVTQTIFAVARAVSDVARCIWVFLRLIRFCVSFHSATSIRSSVDPSVAHHQQLRIVVNSPKSNWELASRLSDFKLAPIRAQLKLARTLVHRARSSWENNKFTIESIETNISSHEINIQSHLVFYHPEKKKIE